MIMAEYGSPESESRDITFRLILKMNNQMSYPAKNETIRANRVDFTETHVIFRNTRGDVKVAYLATHVLEIRSGS